MFPHAPLEDFVGLRVGTHDERLIPLDKIEKWAPINAISVGLLLAPLFGGKLVDLRHGREYGYKNLII